MQKYKKGIKMEATIDDYWVKLKNSKNPNDAINSINELENHFGMNHIDYINNSDMIPLNHNIKKIVFKEIFKISDTVDEIRETMDLSIEFGNHFSVIRYGIDKIIENFSSENILIFEEEVIAYGKKSHKIVLKKIKDDIANNLNEIICEKANNVKIRNIIGKIINSNNLELIEENIDDIKKYCTSAQKEKIKRDFPEII